MSKEKVYSLHAVSPGIAIGGAYIVRKLNRLGAVRIHNENSTEEIARLEKALEETRNDINGLHAELKNKLSGDSAEIFSAHLMLASDPGLINSAKKIITDEKINAEYGFYLAAEQYANILGTMKDDYLRERASDVLDVANRVIAHMTNCTEFNADAPAENAIIFAHDLSPSETVLLDPREVRGFVLESGSPTSHTAILARSMHMPALVGMSDELFESLNPGEKVIVDGFSGKLILNPDHRTEESYRLKAEVAGKFLSELLRDSALAAETLDGFAVQLAANLETPDNMDEVTNSGAQGVGLFRTEFLLFNHADTPTEDEQFEIYKNLLQANSGKPVIIRTFDVGGDKIGNLYGTFHEENPFLGLRGIRLCLKEQIEVFRTQIRALLRAGAFGDLRILIPMISVAEEIYEVKKIIAEEKSRLKKGKVRFSTDVKLGAMIETPAAALLVDVIGSEVDFFSIGSNDLVQYTLAIDRNNERVSYLYQPSHPVVLGLIARCVAAARRHNIWVGICGEMAGSVEMTPILVGLGIQELSMEPASIGAVRRVIRNLKMHDAELLARDVLECSTAAKALELSRKLLRKAAPEVAQNLIPEE